MAESWAADTRGGRGEIGPFLLVYYQDATSNLQDFIVFPVAPSDIQATYGHIFTDFEIVGLGEAAIRGGDRLASLVFSSFFPRDYDTYVDDYYTLNGGLKAPYEYEQIIHKIRQVGRPCQLLIGGTNINWTCQIRSFTIEHRGGEPGDIYYTIEFKKHRFITLEKRQADSPAPAPQPRPRPAMNEGAPNLGEAVNQGQKESMSGYTYLEGKGWTKTSKVPYVGFLPE